MNKKETEILIARIEKWYAKLPNYFIYNKLPFEAKFGWSKEKVPFKDRLSLDYKSIKEGEEWGNKWESAWFHLKADMPSEWVGKKIASELDFSGEGLVYDNRGNEIQGITNASIWDQNFVRTRVILGNNFISNRKIEMWVEAAANSLFGVFTDPDVKEESPKKHGWFDAKVEKMKVGIFDEELWHLYLDVRILIGLLKHLNEKSVQRSRIVKSLNNAINAFGDTKKKVKEARDCLKEELGKKASASNLNVSAIGHAHIDTGWLWPVKETIRKCARTFSTQLDIIDKYPDYIFGASQPQHYQFIKDYYPGIFERIKKAVKRGQWELQGGMWVEADCNLISGESMVRQLIHGKNFFKDEFGIEVDNLWLPDVFGYSAALPQILKKSGVNYFLTQKLSWSQFNEFPHHTFNWRGIDGTEILTHFPPENTYNSELDTQFLVPAQDHFKEKSYLNEFISLFGVGDGGGGPKPENIELGRRMASLESSPKVSFDTAKNFFDRLNNHKDKVDTWVGELYLELHRGTLTTHGLVKKQNRKLENKLRNVEILWSCLSMQGYPLKELDVLWKKLLINQFHDIIPGSSINLVYQATHKEYEEIHNESDKLINKASNKLFEKEENSFVLFNPLSYQWEGTIPIPEGFEESLIEDQNGKSVKTVLTNQGIVGLVNLAPLSFTNFRKKGPLKNKVNTNNSLILENDLVRYEFDKLGRLKSCRDKEDNKEYLMGFGNVISLYEDIPNNWDAWDIDFFYRDALIETAKIDGKILRTQSEFYQDISFSYKIGNSILKQTICLNSSSKRLDFNTIVLWKEKFKMLRVHFPINIRSDQASFDIQYGYVKRNTHRNTSWDKAKFEVVGHHYADLSDLDNGVALMNDCKYGYMVHDNILDLNLLRSPNNPDPDADMGSHSFTYSFFPHRKDLVNSDVMSESACLNQPPLIFKDVKSKNKVPVHLEGEGLELMVLKKAEKTNHLVIRIVEKLGRKTHGYIHLNGKLTESDLIEWKKLEEQVNVKEKLKLNFKPFEIKTFLFENSH